MKTWAKSLGLVLITNIPAMAAVSASHHSAGGSSSSHAGHISAGPRPSGGHVVVGHHGHGHYYYPGLYFYNDFWWGYPYYYSYGYSYPASEYPAAGAYSPSGPTYEQLGRFWAHNLKEGKSTREQFIAFLQSDLLKAGDPPQRVFEKEFVQHFGKDRNEASSLFNRAMNEARTGMPVGASPPKIEPAQPATSP
jgi:hypothetical protein